MAVLITKADGMKQEFDEGKLMRSLLRAGADEGAARSIASWVSKEVYEGATTRDIYHRAYVLLRGQKPAARYSLKRAVFEFGPSGFPFEKYVAEVFRAQGYSASTDRIIAGRCVEHEVDVVLERGGDAPESVYIEVKFHNTIGFKTDEQTALYVQARMQDIAEGLSPEKTSQMRGMLVTNTKFTSRATQYAVCRGLQILSWDYPERGNLHDMIEETRQFPITILTSLSTSQKQKLLTAGVVLCRDVAERPEILRSLGIAQSDVDIAQKEATDYAIQHKNIG